LEAILEAKRNLPKVKADYEAKKQALEVLRKSIEELEPNWNPDYTPLTAEEIKDIQAKLGNRKGQIKRGEFRGILGRSLSYADIATLIGEKVLVPSTEKDKRKRTYSVAKK